jgi:hypothetical protein
MPNRDCEASVRKNVKFEDKDDPAVKAILALARAIDSQFAELRAEVQSVGTSPRTYMRRPR